MRTCRQLRTVVNDVYFCSGELRSPLLNLFLTVLEADKFKIKVLANLISGEGSHLSLVAAAFLLHPHRVERERAGSLVSLVFAFVFVFI